MKTESKRLKRYRELLHCVEGAYKSLSEGTDGSDKDGVDCIDTAFTYLKEARGRVSGLMFDEIEKNKRRN